MMRATTEPSTAQDLENPPRYLTPLLGAAAAATSIASSPLASADPTPVSLSCAVVSAGDTECQTPGNVEINDSAPVQFVPQYHYWEGDSWHHDGQGGRR